jgi:hypothetical protein
MERNPHSYGKGGDEVNYAAYAFKGGAAVKEEFARQQARVIGKSHTSITGTLVSVKDRLFKSFESPLERDFLILMDFDWTVSSFYHQPVKIRFSGPDGSPRTYVPDVLVFYDIKGVPNKWRKPLLAEIKTKVDLAHRRNEYSLKFKAAEKFAKRRGWEFRVLTEDDIRTPFLSNARFLRQFRDCHPPLDQHGLLISTLKDLDETTPIRLIDEACLHRERDPEYLEPIKAADPEARAMLIRSMWHLVCMGIIKTDYHAKLTMESPIWYHLKRKLL